VRVLFIALLVANALMAAAIVFHDPGGREAGLLEQQIQPEKIRIVPLEEAIATRQGPASKVAACLEWGVLAKEDAERARSRLETEGLGAKTSERATEHAGSFWIYLPPAANREETNQRIDSLKSKGLTEYFLVQDPGRWRNAISLGLFRSAESANKFLEDVRAKGFDYAEMSERGPREPAVTLIIRDPSDVEAARIASIRADFPGTELKATTCEGR
jgi:hypothetical protein